MLAQNDYAVSPQYLQFFASRFFPPTKIQNRFSSTFNPIIIVRIEAPAIHIYVEHFSKQQRISYPVVRFATTLDTMQDWKTKLSCKYDSFSFLLTVGILVLSGLLEFLMT